MSLITSVIAVFVSISAMLASLLTMLYLHILWPYSLIVCAGVATVLGRRALLLSARASRV